LIDALRERGVVHFKEGDLELVLGALPDAEEGDKEVDNAPKTGGKVGKDGLTAEQQLDNYGVVIDAK